MYASFKLFQISPVVFVNVLDPKKHRKDIEAKSYEVKNHQAVVKTTGFLLDELTVKTQNAGAHVGEARIGEAVTGGESVTLTADTDYIAEFDEYGYLVITVLSAGKAYEATQITVVGWVVLLQFWLCA